MKRLRVAAALLFQFLLLQVSVLGGGLACAAAPAAATHEVTHEGGSHAHHAAPAPARADAPAHDAPRHHDGTPAHCATAPGCAALAVASVDTEPDALLVVRSAALPRRVSRPASTHPAPEPPPPRA